MLWLDCVVEREGVKSVVPKLKCKVCTKFADKIRGRKNFSEKWIAGADSVQISNVCDHTQNYQHTHAMRLIDGLRAGLSIIALRISGFSYCARFLGHKEYPKVRSSPDSERCNTMYS